LFVLLNRAPILGRAMPIWDARDSFFPFFVLTADHARAGRIVSWDVWSNAGLPRLGDPEFGAVWPLQLLVGVIFGGTPMGFIAYWMIVWWLGGLGMFLLARHLRAPPWAAFVVVSGYAWSGVYTGHAEHVSWLVGFSALPYVIWRLDRALITRTWFPAVQSGAIWGAAAMAAYPGVIIVTALLMFVWTIGRVVTSSDRSGVSRPTGSWLRSAPVHGALALSTAGLVGALCLLPTYVSFFYEAKGVHVRRDPLPRDVVVDNNALDPGALVSSVSPYFAALKIYRPSLWPQTDVSSVSVYTGGSVLVLGFAALALAPRSGWRWFLAVLSVVWIGIAVGSALPLRGWLYDWVYPTRFFRHAAMFRLYFRVHDGSPRAAWGGAGRLGCDDVADTAQAMRCRHTGGRRGGSPDLPDCSPAGRLRPSGRGAGPGAPRDRVGRNDRCRNTAPHHARRSVVGPHTACGHCRTGCGVCLDTDASHHVQLRSGGHRLVAGRTAVARV
jgi:hypothetical protein